MRQRLIQDVLSIFPQLQACRRTPRVARSQEKGTVYGPVRETCLTYCYYRSDVLYYRQYE